jgi:hypothetical protein
MFSERASIHSSGENRTARSLLSRTLASVVLPEPGNPHTIINLGPPDVSITRIILERPSFWSAGKSKRCWGWPGCTARDGTRKSLYFDRNSRYDDFNRLLTASATGQSQFSFSQALLPGMSLRLDSVAVAHPIRSGVQARVPAW